MYNHERERRDKVKRNGERGIQRKKSEAKNKRTT